ncbi:MAG: phosphatase PAP2 family protein [Dokdonella sp.]
MSRRFLIVIAGIAVVLVVLGLTFVDYSLVRWVQSLTIANSPVFRNGLAALDALVGMHVFYWLSGCLAIAIGLLGQFGGVQARWHRFASSLLAAGIVQVCALAIMIQGKGFFGRLRPIEVLSSGDWSHVWFVGGGSFPSGHGAYYFGLFLPLAAAATNVWLRAILLAIPVFAISARIDMSMHFLSDVTTSALIAALLALLVDTIMKRWLPHFAIR